MTTSRLTHATPASFYAHVVDRDLESEIARFLVGLGPQGQTVDLALGGGSCFFIGNGTGGCRTDGEELLESAKGRGVRVLEGMKELREWKDGDYEEGLGGKKGKAILGLFAKDVSLPLSFIAEREKEELIELRESSIWIMRWIDNELPRWRMNNQV